MKSNRIKATTSLPLLTCLGVFMLLFAFLAGGIGGYLGGVLSRGSTLQNNITNGIEVSVASETSAIIEVVENSSDSVVSIVITKDLPVYENEYYSPFGDSYYLIPRRRQVGTEEQQVGAGTGFIINSDGLILTNRHVVEDAQANYTVILNNGTRLSAEVLARDSILDIAVVQVDPEDNELIPLALGDSDVIKVGQNAIAIGNSLGRFSNSVSAGIISGLGRSIVASGGSSAASRLEGVIQTDASINPGNSGGPLLDISGRVIGVNVAIAANAENIGFAIPINLIKPIIDSIDRFGEIRRPYLGVRYIPVDPASEAKSDLGVDYGALLSSSNDEPAIIPDGPADKAGLRSGDIILEINNVKLDNKTSLQLEILKYNVGEEITIKYLRGGQENILRATLGQLPSN